MTKEELENLKREMLSNGIKEGSVEWQKLINNAFNLGGYSGTRNPNLRKAINKENPDKNSILGLLWLLRDYIDNGKINPNKPVDEYLGKQIQAYLLGRGYNLGYTGVDGKFRSGVLAEDGRLGNKTILALNSEIATMRGSADSAYELDFRQMYNGQLPTYNNVAGRLSQQVRAMSLAYYDYLKNNPEIFAGLLQNKDLAAQVLPYLSSEALSLLAQTASLYKNPETGRTLNIPEMAYQGLLGDWGNKYLLDEEKKNVARAKDRGALDLIQTIGGDVLGAGLKIMGKLTGGEISDMGGLTYGYTFNPVTRSMQRVAIPQPTSTVASNLGIINPEGNNGFWRTLGGAVVNTATDPLFWLGSAANSDWNPNTPYSYKVADVPGRAYTGTMVSVEEGMPLNGGMGTVGVVTEAVPGQIIPEGTATTYTLGLRMIEAPKTVVGKPKYYTLGNRVNGFGPRKTGGVNKVVSTSDPTSIYVPALYEPTVTALTTTIPSLYQMPIYDYHNIPYTLLYGSIEMTPYIALRPALAAYGFGEKPGDFIFNPAYWPAARGESGIDERPLYEYDVPDGLVMFNYETMPNGTRYINIDDLDGNNLYRIPSANTTNLYRADLPQSGFLPLYWKGIYKKGGLIKKRCKK